jgi:hypothetical protein
MQAAVPHCRRPNLTPNEQEPGQDDSSGQGVSGANLDHAEIPSRRRLAGDRVGELRWLSVADEVMDIQARLFEG